MVLGVVAGLKNRELVMAGVVGGDCRDKMADRLPRSYRNIGLSDSRQLLKNAALLQHNSSN